MHSASASPLCLSHSCSFKPSFLFSQAPFSVCRTLYKLVSRRPTQDQELRGQIRPLLLAPSRCLLLNSLFRLLRVTPLPADCSGLGLRVQLVGPKNTKSRPLRRTANRQADLRTATIRLCHSSLSYTMPSYPTLPYILHTISTLIDYILYTVLHATLVHSSFE